MSEREKAYQLLDIIPDYNIKYVIAYLQNLTENGTDKLNEETIATFHTLLRGANFLCNKEEK